MSCELMLIISNTINPTSDIQVLDLVFVHIKQAFGLTAAGAGCACHAVVNSSTAKCTNITRRHLAKGQHHVAKSASEGEKHSECRRGQPAASTRRL